MSEEQVASRKQAKRTLERLYRHLKAASDELEDCGLRRRRQIEGEIRSVNKQIDRLSEYLYAGGGDE